MDTARRGHRRRQAGLMALLLAVVLGLGGVAPSLASESQTLTRSENLAELGALAHADGVPVLLMFSAPHCDYCRRLEKEVLGPMAQWENDPRRVVMSKVEVGAGELLRDFNGRRVTADVLADVYEVDVFPTLVLVNAQGQRLLPKIVGYQTPEFYPAYLDLAIKTGQQLIRAQD